MEIAVLVLLVGLLAWAAGSGAALPPGAGYAGAATALAGLELGLAAGAVVFWLSAWRRGRVPYPRGGAAPWFWAVPAAAALSLLRAAYLHDTLTALGADAAWAVAFLLAWWVATQPARRRALLLTVALVVTGLAAYGLAQFVRGTPTTAAWLGEYFRGRIPIRVYGTLGNPNFFAAFLVLGSGAAAALALSHPTRLGRTLGAAFLSVDLLAILVTYSRGGYAGLGAALLAVLALSGRRWRTALVRLAAPLAVTAAGVALLPQVAARAFSLAHPLHAGGTAISRLFMWRDGAAILAHFPWTGGGAGGVAALYSAFRPLGVYDTTAYLTARSLDNDPLQWAAQTGVVGVAVLLVALVLSWRSLGRRLADADAERAWQARAVLAAAAGVALQSTVETSLLLVVNGFLLALLCGTLPAEEGVWQLAPAPRLAAWLLPLAAAGLAGAVSLRPALAWSTARQAAALTPRRPLAAVALYRRAAGWDPLNASFPSRAGQLLLAQAPPGKGLHREAVILLHRAEALDPWDPNPPFALAQYRAQKGDAAAAGCDFGCALRLDPYSPYVLTLTANLLARTGHPRAAYRDLTLARRILPAAATAARILAGPRSQAYRTALDWQAQVARERAALARRWPAPPPFSPRPALPGCLLGSARHE
ncbi:MAG: O-antigen ligase family protein [Thermaerobacter sp.]|nr:O-antigen ligase family protein [Thermaerobacter sp.]